MGGLMKKPKMPTQQIQQQQTQIEEQKRREQVRLAESEDEVKRRAISPVRRGRSLLIATSPTGVKSDLGGTNG